MKLLGYLLVFIIISLIKIGDTVLLLAKLPLIVLRKLLFIFKHGVGKAASLLMSLIPAIQRGCIRFLARIIFLLHRLKRIVIHYSHHLYSSINRETESIEESYRIDSLIKKANHKNHKKSPPFRIIYTPFLVRFRYFVFGTIFSFLFIFSPLLAIIFIQDLPNPQQLTMRQIPQTTKIYDRNGVLLYQIYANQNRTLVPLSAIPKDLQHATIAIEDKDFYNHPGFDISAIIRSSLSNISGKELQGGSTITQQLIKSALLTPETTFNRKLREVILAFWAERIYAKDQILEAYLNQVPYGGTAWGIEAASEVYFGKKVTELNLPESAFLAGIPRAPTIYSPFGTNPTLWKKRQKDVLARMAELGYITQEESQQATQEELIFRTPQVPIYAPHFVMYIRDLLVKKYGISAVEKGGLHVITSLDLTTQETAEKIVAEEVHNNAYLNLTNGAAVITNPANGDIIAMVGSKDFSDPNGGNVNLATSLRQPGSSIKIVTYSAALSKDYTAATILDDSPATYTAAGAPAYSPVNYDGRFHGRVPLRIAFANSFNIPAVRTLNHVGIPTMVDLAKRMGIQNWKDPDEYGLSITLGAAEATMLDMATIYGTVANSGLKVEPDPIIKITDYKGTVIEEKSPLKQNPDTARQLGARVLDEGVSFIISDILADNRSRALEFGTNSPLNIPGHTVSVKTGTSDNKRDNWTIGYTTNWVVTVWVGNNDNSPMSQRLASGITGAAPIWNKIMTYLLTKEAERKRAQPNNIISKPCLGRMEYFVKGTENFVNCIYRPPSSPSPSQ